MDNNIIIKDLESNEYLAFYTYSDWYDVNSFPDVHNVYLMVNSEGEIIKAVSGDDEKELVLPNGNTFLSVAYTSLLKGGFCIMKQAQNDLQKAVLIASNAFSARKDKAGRAYISHLLYVMGKGQNEKEKIVGMLHDLIEDCSDDLSNEICLQYYGTETYSDLILKEFGEEIFDAVKCLTKIKGEDYDVYLKKVKDNTLARQVKLYDLEHNMDISRLSNPKTEDYDRLEKYKKSYNYLKL